MTPRPITTIPMRVNQNVRASCAWLQRTNICRITRRVSLLTMVILLACAPALMGCKKRAIDKALDSDANGYTCLDCEAKFYTDRDVFASHCVKCKKVNIEQVLGFVCESDKAVSIGPRNRGAKACPKCGRPTTAIKIPMESELKAWGAVKAEAADVGG